MKNKTNYQNMTELLNKFKSLDERFTLRLKSKIGVKKSGTEKQVLKYSVLQNDPIDQNKETVPFVSLSVMHNSKKVVKNLAENPYFSQVIDGLSEHKNNPFLFLIIDPESLINDESSTINETVNTIPNLKEKEKHAVEYLNTIGNFHTNKPLTLLNLDNGESGGIYVELGLNAEADENLIYPVSNLAYYSFEKKVAEIKPQVTFYSLPIDNDKIVNLNEETINHLYDLYQDTIGNVDAQGNPSPNPLVIQCEDSLNRGPKFAFAFELLRNFDTYFSSNIAEEVFNQIISAFDDLRRSISPIALSDIEEVKQALALAFALKLVELERRYLKDIENLIETEQKNTRFAPVKVEINLLLENLKKCSTSDAKEHLINVKVLTTPALYEHYSLIFNPFSSPTQFTLLKDLGYCYNTKKQILATLLKLAGAVPEEAPINPKI